MPNEPLQVSKCPHCGATHEGGRFCSVCGKAIPAPPPDHFIHGGGDGTGTVRQPISVQDQLSDAKNQLADALKQWQDAQSRIKDAEEKAKNLEGALVAKGQELENLAKQLSAAKGGGAKGWAIKSLASVLIAGSSLGGGYKWGQHNAPAGSPEVKNEAMKSASTPVKHAPTPEPTVAVKNESQAATKSKPATTKPVVHATPAPKMQTFTLDLETKRDDTVVSVGDGKISSDDKKTKFAPNGPVPTGHYRVESTNTSTRGPKVQIENPARANGWLTKMIIHGKGKLTVTMEWKPI